MTRNLHQRLFRNLKGSKRPQLRKPTELKPDIKKGEQELRKAHPEMYRYRYNRTFNEPKYSYTNVKNKTTLKPMSKSKFQVVKAGNNQIRLRRIRKDK